MKRVGQIIGGRWAGRRVGAAGLVLLWFLASTGIAGGATFRATLDRSSVAVGESVTLSLIFENGTPRNMPAFQVPPNLGVQPIGPSHQISIVNGRTRSSLSYNYHLTPSVPGDYVIEPIEVEVNNQVLRSQPLTLRATKSSAPTAMAFLKLAPTKETVYVGEMFPVEVQLYLGARQDSLQMPQLSGEGFMFGSMPQPTQSSTQIGNQMYTIVTFRASAVALKTGSLSLGPATCSMILHVPPTTRSRSLFDDFWGGGVQRKPVNLASEPVPITVLPLPVENRPPTFNGAVGNFTMTASAGPTNLAVGDPITLRVQISGQGNLESLPFPADSAWSDFKLYSPTSSVESSDPLGMAGVKFFERVVIPQQSTLRQLPALQFAFFDPDQKAYRTLEHPPIPINVRRIETGQPRGPGLAEVDPPRESADATPDIVNIKPHLGAVTSLQPPLIMRPWFLLLQMFPLAAFVSAWIWRKRHDNLARNPRLRRHLKVRETVRAGLKDLARCAEAQQSEAFFAALFRLLQEQLGERLDMPASAITEAVVDERLRGHVSEELVSQLHVLFQACNQARYAPHRSTAELMDLLPMVETALADLRQHPAVK